MHENGRKPRYLSRNSHNYSLKMLFCGDADFFCFVRTSEGILEDALSNQLISTLFPTFWIVNFA